MPILDGNTQAHRDSIARFFAPVIYQEVDNSERDFLARVTFDGDWNGRNNWYNSLGSPKRAYVYVSLVEDANHYFIHYGTYHPVDWCSGLGAWGVSCISGNDEHENDMEGMKIVIDKRFTTSNHPFGQILTMETIFHHTMFSYQNCSVEGGYPQYVRPAQNASVIFRGGHFDGCIPFTGAYNFGTTPAPPNRPTLYIEPQGHGNRIPYSLAAPFESHGITYWPSNSVAETPTTTSQNEEDAYKLQWVDNTEATTAYTLWSQRLNFNYFDTYQIFINTDATLIGPHDIYYLNLFVCSQHCPWLVSGNAKAPWGVVTEELPSEHRGDWHNHPAWAWAHHYQPSGAYGTTYFDYSCLSEGCRMTNTYSYNPYWADSYWLAGAGTGSGTPAPCKSGPCPPTAPPFTSRGFAHELRWDFETMADVKVSGGLGMHAEATRIPDPDWGYKGGASILRVTGRGMLRVDLAGLVETEKNDFALIRFRQSAPSVSPRIGWSATRQDEILEDRVAVLDTLRTSSNGWEVRVLPLAARAAWRAVKLVRNISLFFDLGLGAEGTLELDFVVVSH